MLKNDSNYDVDKRSVGYTLFLDKGKPGENQRRKAKGATAIHC
ncbi:hypothetical protein SAMD00020551_3781 [Mesobacillus selenatarsenatis SF-1]|uniref:Uncharacterized protein n=1 Tax=Mesobacillus selenatarsenatis (strain DSM 18680 / JCM 14380 / FERM P-15431 / SF-1) TaxID=1321606 RepID=A0A0A8X8K6_MESS1|nr:hypothetical protein SAMD00020551_3781 [Mesobacillus selenatarsenatis SF-1]